MRASGNKPKSDCCFRSSVVVVAEKRDTRNKFRQIVTMAMDFLAAQLRFVCCLLSFCLSVSLFIVYVNTHSLIGASPLAFGTVCNVHSLFSLSHFAFVQLLRFLLLCKAIEWKHEKCKWFLNARASSQSIMHSFRQLIGLWLPFRIRDIYRYIYKHIFMPRSIHSISIFTRLACADAIGFGFSFCQLFAVTDRISWLKRILRLHYKLAARK